MFRRSILQISSRRSVRRVPRQFIYQIPPFISSNKEFSTSPTQNASQKQGSSVEPPKSGSFSSKVAVGGVAISAAVFAAYQSGYMDHILSSKDQKSSIEATKVDTEKIDAKNVPHLVEQQLHSPDSEETEIQSPVVGNAEQKVETDSNPPPIKPIGEKQGDEPSEFQDNSNMSPEEGNICIEEKGLPEDSQNGVESGFNKSDSSFSTEDSLDIKNVEDQTLTGLDQGVQTTQISTQDDADPGENEIKTMSPHHVSAEDSIEESLDKGLEPPSSLLDAYHLKDEFDVSSESKEDSDENTQFQKNTEAFISAIEELNDGYISKDGKLVVDFLQAIHAAEKTQAELDARIFSEEKRALKERYEKELKDAQARELMHAEEAAMLDKELKRERAKAAAALNSLREKLEGKLQMELKQKENEVELKLRKMQELAKAELAAAISSEKAAQIEKMAEANLNINALCMAFYARSEEARQSHSAQRLALGALALEDALSRGLPIQAEIEALRFKLEGIDKDSNLELVISSIPEEILYHGTDTLLQLDQKFDILKGTLRHFSLIPPSGGSILTHSLAHVASWLKVKEVDQSGSGIESVINRVESYLAEGKLADAADSLEEGVKGTQAADVVCEWVTRARNRAITEQALTVLQSYATSISLT